MALKFRRGTTAQKSGSLAFGEPYVNTTLGALQVGLESGDITIRSVDSSSAIVVTSISASTFISASSLKVTGDTSIDGNLTLGGNITIGDQTTDTISITANLSSSIIPSDDNVFDLGSSSKKYQSAYLGGNLIVDGLVDGVNVSVLNSNITDFSQSANTRFTEIGVVSGSLIASASSFESRNASLATITGSLIASASSFESRNASLATISGSLILTASNNVQRLTAIEAVSGSWITESETSSFSRTNTSNTFEGDQAVTGNLVVTGSITANEFHITLVSSSVMYASGSNTFGNSVDDLQQLIGIVEITGSIKGTQFNDLATITGSLISSASSFESRNASLATISGSLILTASNHEDRLDVIEGESGSYARNNTANSFVGNQTITGSLVTSGSLVEFNVLWPASGTEQHIIKTDGFTLDGRTYEYAGVALTHYEDTPGTLHNAMAMYMFDPTNTYGSEILTGPYRTHMQSYPSGSGGNVANVSVQDLKNGKTQALVYGDYVQIGAFHAESIIIGNSNSVIEISGSIKNAQLTAIGTITGSLISSASSFESRNSTLATYTASVDTRLTEIGVVSGSLISTASANVISITNLNSFSSSQLTKDSTLATYTSSVETRLTEIGVVSGSLITSASAAKTTNDSQDVSITNLNSYTSSLNNAIQLTGSTVSFLGNIVVYGTQSVINSTNLAINDNLIYLNEGSSITNPDLGIVGNYNDGVYAHSGIFRDASDGGAWKVFEGYTLEPSGTIDTTGNGFTLADFKAGAFTGTSFNGQIIATNGVVSGSSQINLASVTGNSTSNVSEGSNLYYTDARVKTKLDAEGVISSSAQLTTTFDSRYLNTGGDGVFSGSSQIPNSSITNAQLANNYIQIAGYNIGLGTAIGAATIGNAIGAFSGSSQVDLTATTNYASGILTRLNAVGVFSGSAQVSGLSNAQLSNSTISGKALGTNLDTLTIGTGLSGTSYNGSSAVTIANTGVLSNVAGTGVSVSSGTGNVTISIGQSVATNATPTFGNLTINGTITATGDITAYYTSDRRHKNNIKIIPDALSKVTKLNGVTWEWNDDVNEVTKSTPKTGLIAQEVQEVLPEVVVERENGYLGLDYSKMVGLLVEAIKEQQIKIDNLTIEVEKLKKQKGL